MLSTDKECVTLLSNNLIHTSIWQLATKWLYCEAIPIGPGENQEFLTKNRKHLPSTTTNAWHLAYDKTVKGAIVNSEALRS
jgi:hypothetical protein